MPARPLAIAVVLLLLTVAPATPTAGSVGPAIAAGPHAACVAALAAATAPVAVTVAPVIAAARDDAVAADESPLLERGRTLARQFHAGETEALWELFTEPMRATIGSPAGLAAFQQQAQGQLGAETGLVSETCHRQGNTTLYVRTARFAQVPVTIDLILGFDDTGRVETFLVRPTPVEAPSEHLDYETKTPLRLPFDGEWDVFWGGRSIVQNYHAAHVDQRFAYDLLVIVDGSSHTGDGSKNEDYHCYGRPILAPGAGVVVTAVDGVPDNVPGRMNPQQAAGNHVILDHGNGEYSLLAHFQPGTLEVEEGERVESGRKLGLCGNSGNSTEPHLHYHLQDAPEFGKGAGLPPQFLRYLADGEPVERGEPVKGQRLRMP